MARDIDPFKLSSPRIFLVRMLVFLILCGLVVTVLYRQIWTAFLANPGLNLDLGTAAIDYVLTTHSSAYFPMRLVKSHLARGRLKSPKRARKFVYPVCMVYPQARDEEAYEPILGGLRREAAKLR